MTVSELRAILQQCEEDDMKHLVVELYKAMPKKLKEVKEIDRLIKDTASGLREKKSGRQEREKVMAKELQGEIELFLENAYAQNYFVPNRIVPKSERPKWRFKVKSYIKDLSKVASEGEDGRLAAQLLEKLYKMLCYGCCCYIFNTEDTFKSIGMEQTELFDLVVRKTFQNELNRENICRMVATATGQGVSRTTLTSSLLMILIAGLKTTDSKKIAIEEARKHNEIIIEKEAESSKRKRNLWYDSEQYERKEQRDNLTELIFCLYMELCEYDAGIDYYKKYICKIDSEVSLFCLLELLLRYDLKEYWMKEYEAALKKKVKPRESLQSIYGYIKEHGEWPEDVYL